MSSVTVTVTDPAELARETLDAWDLKHWGRKPIADTSFQYLSREDLIVSVAAALRTYGDARASEARETALEEAAKTVERGKPLGIGQTATRVSLQQSAYAIRALAKKPEERG